MCVVEIEFGQAALDRFNEIFPGYGEDPYSYAWCLQGSYFMDKEQREDRNRELNKVNSEMRTTQK